MNDEDFNIDDGMLDDAFVVYADTMYSLDSHQRRLTADELKKAIMAGRKDVEIAEEFNMPIQTAQQAIEVFKVIGKK